MVDTSAVEALKFQGDPLADGVIADLVASDRVGVVNEVLAHFRANDQPVPDDLPASVRDYLLGTDSARRHPPPRRTRAVRGRQPARHYDPRQGGFPAARRQRAHTHQRPVHHTEHPGRPS